MQKTLFCIGIYSVWWPSAFLQKKTKQTNVVKMRDVFREACRHHFFIDFSRFWPPFWEGFGRQNRKKQVSERFEKTVKKKVMQVTPKGAAGVWGGQQAEGGGPLQVSTQASHVPLRSSGASEQGRLKPHEHTSACLEGTVADV